MEIMDSGEFMKRAIILLILGCSAVAAQKMTDADERHRIKYGRYPRHVEEREQRLLSALKERSEQLFRQLDLNKDGKVTDREATTAYSRMFSSRRSATVWLERFQAADGDMDGIVTLQEWRSRGQQEAGQ
jgi:hypothetical protein